MRYDLHLREVVKNQIDSAAKEMSAWEGQPLLTKAQQTEVISRIQPFTHTIKFRSLRVGGVDGSGDFPSIAYADSAVYFSVAQGVIYESSISTGLKEIPVLTDPVIHVTWIPEDKNKRTQVLHDAFTQLAGANVEDVIRNSDYREIRDRLGGKPTDVKKLAAGLVLPHPTDTGNLAIQLRSTAEMGAAYRLLCSEQRPNYVLMDTTLSLPLVGQFGSLFFEHLKRLCCVVATTAGAGFFTISKSHGLPGIEVIENLAKTKFATDDIPAEHWFLRLPIPAQDEWEYPIHEGKMVPPHGAVSYLFRLHRNTPVMRLDMDINYWKKCLKANTTNTTNANEVQIFEDVDYSSHDQRAYGYPYPIKACHDRSSMTMAERVALRKQIIDAAVTQGMKRSLFRDVSIATGHA